LLFIDVIMSGLSWQKTNDDYFPLILKLFLLINRNRTSPTGNYKMSIFADQ
jgi:hypothetical protein